MDNILKQLNAERVNIVEADGTLKMALFNSMNMAPALMDGKDLLPGHREGTGQTGVIFYNTEGDECGGMGFSCGKSADGGYYSSLSMTFDQYKNDQVVQISASERSGKRQYGYTIYDRLGKHLSEAVEVRKIIENPDVPQEEKDRAIDEFKAKNFVRMHVGKSFDGAVAVRINDSKGRERVRVELSPEGVPQIVVLNEDGSERAALPKERS